MGSMAISSETGLEEFVIVNDGVKMEGDKAVKYLCLGDDLDVDG